MREVARHFEQAGVARLDAFFDENEGRYYITQQSVTRAIEEERAKQSSMGTAKVSEKEIPKHSRKQIPDTMRTGANGVTA